MSAENPPKVTYTMALLAYIDKHATEVPDETKYQFQAYITKFASEWKANLPIKEPFDGTLRWGKYKGKLIKNVAKFDQGYLEWVKVKSGYASAEITAEIDKYLTE